jgi:HSP20 family protein
MALTRWTPVDELLSVRDDFDRLFSRLVRRSSQGSEGESLENFGGFRPAVEMEENENSYEVRAELPGLSEDDINLSLKDNVLTIKGEKRTERTEEEREDTYYSERIYGAFQRSIRFDENIEEDSINAEYSNGILRVHLPKSEKRESKEIPITINI